MPCQSCQRPQPALTQSGRLPSIPPSLPRPEQTAFLPSLVALMRHPLRLAIVLTSGAAVLAVASLLAVYRASQQVPDFYREAIIADSQRQAAASKEMLRTATALVNDAQQEGEWEAEFTEEQINGWLAVDLVENH